MGKIVISTNVSLDGVVQDPDGAEGFSRGGWYTRYGGKDLQEWAKIEYAEALGTAALLLGRRSDEWFAARWASQPGEWADRVTRLKQELDGDIVVYASYQLGRTLIEHDLVDEPRLFVFRSWPGPGSACSARPATPGRSA